MANPTPPFNFNGSDPLPTSNSNGIVTSTTSNPHRASLASLATQDGTQSPNTTTPPPQNSHPTSQAVAPVVDSHGRILNPRSCVTCRRRKVKCDKSHPCANCVRAHIDCVFPTPGRAPRRPRKHADTRDTELLERLRRLEGVVKGLGVDVSTATGQPTDSSTKDARTHEDQSAGSSPQSEQPVRRSTDYPSSGNDVQVSERPHGQLENRFGRLVVSEGRSRYVNTSFWASLSNEVEDLKGILNEESDDEDETSPGSHNHLPGHHQGWMFGFSSQSVDMLTLHPIPMQIETYWSIYKDRVDPLVKVLHIPSITPTILTSASHLANLSKGFEALLFAIYYGATTSLTAEECLAKLGEERSVLLSRYRFAVEQALARANFLTAEELVILQAFVVFLMCLRRNNDARVIWTLTGLLVRMSQTVGIHRDGTHFGLPPFEVEMRRRLWWQVCILDVRASEDHGCDPTIVEQSFDTRMPLNVNDSDMSPGMKEFPKEHKGCTDMSFCLIRFEVANTFRRLNYVPPAPNRCHTYLSSITREEKEKWIQECHDMLEEKYLKHCDMTVPLYWVTATVARLIMSKMWLIVYHPYQRQDGGASLPQDIKDKLFITSLENIEYALLLETETRTMKWGWLFKTYMQWHAMAFILSELTKKTKGPLVERAWLAISRVRDGRWGEMNDHGDAHHDARSGYLWKPLLRLHAKALAARQQALEEEGQLEQNNESANSPAGQILPGSVLDYMSRQGSRSSSLLQHRNLASGQSTPQPVFGSMMLDSHKLLHSPTASTSSDNNNNINNGVSSTKVSPDIANRTAPQQTDSPRSINSQDTATRPAHSMNKNHAATWPNSNSSVNPANPMNTSSFGMDNPNNFVMTPGPLVNDPSQMGDVNMTFDANGDLDWANFDNMVRQFGMDIDTTPGNGGQAAAWAGSNWGTFGTNTNGMGMGTSDWF
ncbi:fungal specific transcription factor domain-containing protein 69 [Elsinoe australis]|uniref:Fungal specific transcription factor domain-containing protein 69 n=1 Tax=Elsinoe australis TaxID=40998 RepID=A0A4U7AMA7_9PEZI|nr:fungal specific transcription factor domain-containing protein 69 [Elsinoe australis]